MARRKYQLTQTGVTPEGFRVMGGVYAVYETQGMPLDAIFHLMWERQAYPDWVDLIKAMVKAGRPVDRAFVAVRSAVNDACYPIDVGREIQKRLVLLEERWAHYAV